MFSRFSSASRRVLRAAEQECRNHNHFYVGAEHVLYALLEEHDPDVEARLRERHVSGSDAHAAIKRALGMGEERMWEGILVTPRVRKIVKRAEKRAGDGEIEPVHLFDAIYDEGAGLTAEILGHAARNSADWAQ